MNSIFISAFQGEWLKKRRSLAARMIIIGAFFTPTVIIIARLISYDKLGAVYSDAAFWKHLWGSAWESMAVFLLPLGAILFTSLVTQLEFKNNAWKQLHTLPLPLTAIYFTKLAVILIMILQFILLFTLGVLVSGALPALAAGLNVPAVSLPLILQFLREDFVYFILILPVIVFQYTISLFNKNFLVPVGLGFILWVGALSMLSWKYNVGFPYIYVMLRYLQGKGKGQLAVSPDALTVIATGWFIIITITGYLLYILKREKG